MNKNFIFVILSLSLAMSANNVFAEENLIKQIISTYQANEARFHANHRNHILSGVGKVEKIVSDFMGTGSYFTVVLDIDGSIIQCNTKNKNMAAKLDKEQIVKFKGVIYDVTLSTLILENCQFSDYAPTESISTTSGTEEGPSVEPFSAGWVQNIIQNATQSGLNLQQIRAMPPGLINAPPKAIGSELNRASNEISAAQNKGPDVIVNAPTVSNKGKYNGYIYFASEKPPVGKDIPQESPLCYRFKVDSIEEQLSKLQKKYGAKFQGKIDIESDGHKTLTGTRTDENNNYIPYKYFTNPEACNMAQRIRILTVPEELKSEVVQLEVLNLANIEQYIDENYAEHKNDLNIETIPGTNNGKIHFISFNHNDYCGSAGCNLIIATDVGDKIYVLWNDNVYNYKILSNIAIRLELHRSYCNQPDAQSCDYTYRIINNNQLRLTEVNGNPSS